MTVIFYRSHKDKKYYLNKDNKCHLDKNIICNSCDIKSDKYYIFSKKISSIFNIIDEKYICHTCYEFKKKIQDKYSMMDVTTHIA